MMPASVCTAISAWIESSRLISADQPPFGLSPRSGTAAIETMRTGELVGIAASSVDAMGANEIQIDFDADTGQVRDEHRAVRLELERGRGDAARQRALADVELDEAGTRQAGDELQAEAGQEVGQPGMRYEIDARFLGKMRDF